jgi:YHS domain-containing protein
MEDYRIMIKQTLAAGALTASLFSLAQGSAALAGPVYTGLQGDIAVGGYDAVSYFSGDGTPVMGSPDHVVQHKGVIYQFASVANAETFRADPERYAPQYGGHCAWAMARGYLAPGDPLQSRVEGGKLYLNFNAEVKAIWLKDVPGFIASGDGNWPGFPDDAKFGG